MDKPLVTTALIHYWFYAMRGGERVVENILELFPKAPIYTHLFLKDQVTPGIRAHPVHTTLITKLPLAHRQVQAYLPLMPWALRRLDMSAYDLIISSESGPAKGIRVGNNALHICYCHSPMRYIWFQQGAYLAQANPMEHWYLRMITPAMQRWDLASAKNVNWFIANSRNVQERIYRIYGRDSEIIYPPVHVDRIPLQTTADDYFLWVGQLVPYKRPDLVIQVFNRNGLPLRIVGTGLLEKALQRAARSNIKFLGHVSDEIVHLEMAQARALIFPGEEDFGIVPVEAQAAGTPVIAYNQGGAREWMTAPAGNTGQQSSRLCTTGVLFDSQTIEGLQAAVDLFMRHETEFSASDCRQNAERFSTKRFKQTFGQFVESRTGEKISL